MALRNGPSRRSFRPSARSTGPTEPPPPGTAGERPTTSTSELIRVRSFGPPMSFGEGRRFTRTIPTIQKAMEAYMTELLEGKTAIIYGGGGAIGSGVARSFAREGARVFLAGRKREALDAVAKDITAAGGSAEVAILDALDEN